MKEKIRRIAARLGYFTAPDFIIIGAQKSGTTGLFNILKQHTKISSRIKEVHYFSDDSWFADDTISEYHACFPFPYSVDKKAKVLEATPIYIYHPEVAQRLYKYNSKLKLIVALREPSKRALSAWTMYHYHFENGISQQYHDPRDFSTAIQEELENIENLDFYTNKKGYVPRGIYYDQLVRFFEYFPKDQVLVVENKDLFSFSEPISRQMQSFIGVDYEPLKPVISNKARVQLDRDYSPELNTLKAFFKPHNDKLFSLLDRQFDWN